MSLPQEDVADYLNSQFTYAVTAVEATAPLDNSLGAIGVYDGNIHSPVRSVITPPSSALYVLVAHGKDKSGAYTRAGVIGVPCGSTAGYDSDNCSGGSKFDAAPYSEKSGPSHFDDYIIYINYMIPNCGIQGLVFNGNKCVPAKGTIAGGYTQNLNLSCYLPNSLTGACSCPAGSSALKINEFDNPGCLGGFYTTSTPCGVKMYVCFY